MRFHDRDPNARPISRLYRIIAGWLASLPEDDGTSALIGNVDRKFRIMISRPAGVARPLVLAIEPGEGGYAHLISVTASCDQHPSTFIIPELHAGLTAIFKRWYFEDPSRPDQPLPTIDEALTKEGF